MTEDDVRAILDSKEDALDLAERYGISPSIIHGIRRGTAWRDVPRSHAHERLLPDPQTPPGGDDPGSRPMRLRGTAKITSLQAREIAGSSDRAIDLAARYGIKKNMVDAIRQGRLWEAVTRDVRQPKRP